MKITKHKDHIQINNSEHLVAEDLKARGYTVAVTETEYENGFDIVAIKDCKYITVEVKRVVISVRSNTIKPIAERAKGCDFIAIVTPKNNIYYQPMKEHLLLCNKSGSRGVTKIIKFVDDTC